MSYKGIIEPEHIPYIEKRLEKYATRLLKQYDEHKTLIIAVDFDDTIFAGNVNSQKDLEPIIEKLKEAVEIGLKIVIYTARNEKYFPDIEVFCENIGLKIEAINKDIIQLREPTSGKIYYNLFLDDKAGLEQAAVILVYTIEKIKESKK